MSLRKIAVAKRLGKVFCMGIRVCLFEGVHLTSSLSRSDGGDSGGLLKAVSQTFSSPAAVPGSTCRKRGNKFTCLIFYAFLFSAVLFYFLLFFFVLEQIRFV